MDDRRARQDLRVNVLRADQVGVWHDLLNLALELAKPDAPLRSVRLGCFDFVGRDGRTGTLTPELIAHILGLPAPLVASTIDTLLELGLVSRDGETLSIENAADWFVPLTEHAPRRN